MVNGSRKFFYLLSIVLFCFFLSSCVKKQDVEELSDRIFQKEEEITELRGQVGQLNSEIEKNQKKLDQLESNGKGQSNEARVLKETLHAQTAQQAALNRRISDNEQKIKNNEKRIQAIETSRKAYDDKLQMALEENKRLRNETRDKILEIEDSYKNKRTNADTNDDVEIDETSDSSNQQRDQ